jgi:hypothetical protein
LLARLEVALLARLEVALLARLEVALLEVACFAALRGGIASPSYVELGSDRPDAPGGRRRGRAHGDEQHRGEPKERIFRRPHRRVGRVEHRWPRAALEARNARPNMIGDRAR